MITKSNWNELKERIKFANRIVITTHIHPDGDAIGSELALYYYLKYLGKDVSVLNISDTPEIYHFLDSENIISKYHDDSLLKYSDLIIAVDVSKYDRIEKIAKDAKKNKITMITIDHHPKHSENLFALELIDPKANSTGYLIYQFIKMFDADFIDEKIALFLYCALVTDTGFFKYNNASPEAYLMASELVKKGVNPAEVYEKIYEQSSFASINLLGYVLQNLNVEYDGKVVWIAISQELLKKYGCKMEDMEGFSDVIRSLKNLKISIMFKETKYGKISVNLRSKGNVKINGIAHRFGGGGHPYASGIKFDKPMSDVIPLIINAVGELF